jgi:DNA adenine methylase
LNRSRMRNIKTHGGKSYLAKRIIQHPPAHHADVESYAGGLSVLLNKPPCEAEVASDLDAVLIGYYRVLQDRTDEFLDRLSNVRYDAETFE